MAHAAPPAFAQFNEPFAWLIRGLVEYGWHDITLSNTTLPNMAAGGFDLSRFPDSNGREGVYLEVAAVANGQECMEDGIYRFQVQLADSQGEEIFFVRCPEANFVQEFPWDPENPLHLAGYIHQAIQQYVPEFVEWRLAGGELSWTQREGIPKVPGIESSPSLSDFVHLRLTSHQFFHTGPEENWWVIPDLSKQIHSGPDSDETPNSVVPIATIGKGGGEPVYLSKQAREAGPASPVQQEELASVQAQARVAKPGWAMFSMLVVGGLQGMAFVMNALYTVMNYTDSIFAIALSSVMGLGLMGGSIVSMWGAQHYRTLHKGPMPWISMVYCAFSGVCCFVGLPIAVWAGMTWFDPVVKSARE